MVQASVKRAHKDDSIVAVSGRGRRGQNYNHFPGGVRGHAKHNARRMRQVHVQKAERLSLRARRGLRIGRVLREQGHRHRRALAALCDESSNRRDGHRSGL